MPLICIRRMDYDPGGLKNEFYSRDSSAKIKASFKTRSKAGKYRAKAAPFGFLNALVARIDVREPKEIDGVMQQDIDIHYRHAGLIETVEFDSSRFYKSDKVKQVSRQRMKGKTLEVAEANERERGVAV